MDDSIDGARLVVGFSFFLVIFAPVLSECLFFFPSHGLKAKRPAGIVVAQCVNTSRSSSCLLLALLVCSKPAHVSFILIMIRQEEVVLG
jgi:hypothetical protein